MGAGGNPYTSVWGSSSSFGSSAGRIGGAVPMSSFDKTMLGLGAFQAFTKGIAAFRTSSAQKDVLLYKAELQRRNAEIEDVKIGYTKTRAAQERQALKRKYKLARGSQITGYAGKNILLGGDTPLDIMLSTGVLETADIGILKVKEVWDIFGLEVSKYNATAAGEFLEASGRAISPFTEGVTSLLTSGLETGFNYLAWKHAPVGTGRAATRRYLGF